jgi:antitoxin HicB
MTRENDVQKTLDHYLTIQYQIQLTKREEDDGAYWVAEIPDLPGCYSHGATPDEAVEQLADAKASWIESHLADGYEVPDPVDVRGFSGKLSLRIPKSLHRKISEMARTEGVSLNQYILSCLATGLGADEQLREVRLANRG